jgi:hypothetical protein
MRVGAGALAELRVVAGAIASTSPPGPTSAIDDGDRLFGTK